MKTVEDRVSYLNFLTGQEWTASLMGGTEDTFRYSVTRRGFAHFLETDDVFALLDALIDVAMFCGKKSAEETL